MPRILFICTAVCLGMVVFSVRGDDSPKLIPHHVVIPERGPVSAYLVLVGSNRFRFINPLGWLVSPEANEGIISMVSRDQSASMEIKFAAKPKDADLTKLREIWLPEVKKRQPGGELVREFECRAAGTQGMAFDIEKQLAPGKMMIFRTAFVPVAESLIEFTLVCSPEKLETHSFAFANLMTSFALDLPASEKRPE